MLIQMCPVRKALAIGKYDISWLDNNLFLFSFLVLLPTPVLVLSVVSFFVIEVTASSQNILGDEVIYLSFKKADEERHS
jgi:hypothetical protein